MSTHSTVRDLLNTASREKWERLGVHKRAGILTPLFYVYSKDSVGIGDFDDLKLMVDLCDKAGFSILQLLPMNEVGTTFCPYDSMSSFALEPAYISLNAFAKAGNIKIKNAMADLRRKYPAGRGYVDYRVKAEKLLLLREIFQQDESRRSWEFKKFIEDNEYWINDFALFKAVKEYQNDKVWYEWEERYKAMDYVELKRFKCFKEEEMLFQMWVQWQLYKQFKDAKAYAASKKVLLKGDLPILVSRDSADVWAHREFFKLEFAAGAPPDMYCAKGQRWGMPTYNWEAKSADGYRYLKQKLRYAENFYDILRIDHVVGIFRIWSIAFNEPLENQGLNGNFDPWDQGLWDKNGRERLTVILDSTKMILCAEDLGMIPEACPRVLREFGIPGNEVQRWVKDWNVRHDFLEPDHFRTFAVSMLSTHDTTNWQAWWENEAGTIDEVLFMRLCKEKGMDYEKVKDKLFSSMRSRHGRLRWHNNVDSIEKLEGYLGKHKDEMWDIVNIYENSYKEKEKLWKHLGLKGAMRERCDQEIIGAALDITLKSGSVYCIELLVDLLNCMGVLKGDPFQNRINTPGTVSDKNWSLTSPMPLEDLIMHKAIKDIREKIQSSGRLVTT